VSSALADFNQVLATNLSTTHAEVVALCLARRARRGIEVHTAVLRDQAIAVL
jgi:hypothetical protein